MSKIMNFESFNESFFDRLNPKNYSYNKPSKKADDDDKPESSPGFGMLPQSEIESKKVKFFTDFLERFNGKWRIILNAGQLSPVIEFEGSDESWTVDVKNKMDKEVKISTQNGVISIMDNYRKGIALYDKFYEIINGERTKDKVAGEEKMMKDLDWRK